jgi:hypothetical protein
VAVPKAITAGQVPIHSNPENRVRWPERAAMLTPSSGTNTRKPHAALSPMPMMSAMAVSISPAPQIT